MTCLGVFWFDCAGRCACAMLWNWHLASPFGNLNVNKIHLCRVTVWLRWNKNVVRMETNGWGWWDDVTLAERIGNLNIIFTNPSAQAGYDTRRCPWCNGYRRRKWTRRHEFKSWTSLIAFHIALIPLGKVWIQLFSLQLWVNRRTDLGSSALVRQLV